MRSRKIKRLFFVLCAGLLASGCSQRSQEVAQSAPRRHEHHPPHGGTPVVLGQEAYHLELVADPASGRLQVYVLDAEMEEFVRVAAASLEIRATSGGKEHVLVLQGTANSMTGETVGDTSLFEVQDNWLKGIKMFDGDIQSITVRGTPFADVRFNYPKGNDSD